ncbi:MAG: hypothetical protein ALECFALPRED_000623 [Alectoria fallacina]|uniref:Uncharacterized protein n=1 Tax=Alectoria fallacina TaxID=1903189 RepID=A0A8H3I9N0_9LECA|nr:MAG: hypothetical protein ALECFALPRED_000623 [Alectoria fallacina]
MAPRTRSMALKETATASQESNAHKKPKSKVFEVRPLLKTAQLGSRLIAKKPIMTKTKPNPWCMSDEQIERICGYYSRVARAMSPLKRVRNHCTKLPALLPVEMDFLVKILVPYAKAHGHMTDFTNHSWLDWDAVAESFNDRFSTAVAGCEPRKVKVLKCAMWGNCHKVKIAILRERCRRAHEGEDNAGIYASLTPAELELHLTHR